MHEIDRYDLIVIGGGSGGVSAAKRAAELGAKVAICEKDAMGGTCVNRGCVPKKWLVYASEYSKVSAEAEGFGWNLSYPSFSWHTLCKNSQENIHMLNQVYTTNLEKKGVDIFKGEAKFINANTIKVGANELVGKNILIATGTSPFIPEFEGKEFVHTSDDMFALEQLPKDIAIIGGGYIALEFSGIMTGLGSKVHSIYRGNRLLKNFDDDLGVNLELEMKNSGIDLMPNTEVEKVEKLSDKFKLHLTNHPPLTVDTVMYATGRKPKLQALNLQSAGIDIGNGFITVDDQYQTSQTNIFAIGDVINKTSLTPVAIREGRIVAESLFAKTVTQKIDYEKIATAIFTAPPIGTCGLSESQAIEKGYKISIYKTAFKPLKNLISGSEVKTMMKLVVDKITNKVLGVHMIGADSPEIIQAAAIAVNCGATKKQFDSTMAVHPTTAEELVTMREVFNG